MDETAEPSLIEQHAPAGLSGGNFATEWADLEKYIHLGNVPEIESFTAKIVERYKDEESGSLPDVEILTELSLLAGESTVIVGRWQGDLEKIDQGIGHLEEALGSQSAYVPKITQAHARARLGCAHVRLGFVHGKSPKGYNLIMEGAHELRAGLAILEELDKGPEWTDEMPYHRGSIYRDLGRAETAEASWKRRVFLTAESVRLFKESLKAMGRPGTFDSRYLATKILLANACLAQILAKRDGGAHYCLGERDKRNSLKNQPPYLYLTGDGKFDGERLRSEANKALTEALTDVKPLIQDAGTSEFSHAAMLTDFRFACRRMYQVTRQEDWAEYGLQASEKCFELYDENQQGYKHASAAFSRAEFNIFLENYRAAKPDLELAVNEFGDRGLEARKKQAEAQLDKISGNLTTRSKVGYQGRASESSNRGLSEDGGTETGTIPKRAAETRDKGAYQNQKDGRKNSGSEVSDEDLTRQFEKALLAGEHQGADFLEPYAPTPKAAPYSIIRDTEKALNFARYVQMRGQVFNPPEGLDAFATRVSKFMHDQELCVLLSNGRRARSLTVVGQSLQFQVRGEKSLASVKTIKFDPLPPRKAPERPLKLPPSAAASGI